MRVPCRELQVAGCRLQVRGRELQVGGCRLQVRGQPAADWGVLGVLAWNSPHHEPRNAGREMASSPRPSPPGEEREKAARFRRFWGTKRVQATWNSLPRGEGEAAGFGGARGRWPGAGERTRCFPGYGLGGLPEVRPADGRLPQWLRHREASGATGQASLRAAARSGRDCQKSSRFPGTGLGVSIWRAKGG